MTRTGDRWSEDVFAGGVSVNHQLVFTNEDEQVKVDNSSKAHLIKKKK